MTSARHRPNVLIVGLGDLGRRLVDLLATRGEVGGIVVVSRSNRAAAQLRIIENWGRTRIEAVMMDALDTARLEQLIRDRAPAVIVNCATLLSPWWTFEHVSAQAASLAEAGFGAQLPLQLPILMSVMTAVRETDFPGWIVNASYPDATHPALFPLGLAPDLGVGNVALIAGRVRASLGTFALDAPEDGRTSTARLRVIAHHAHVKAFLSLRPDADPNDLPLIQIGDDSRWQPAPASTLSGLTFDRSVNGLTAFDALELVVALLGEQPVHRSCPGPLGLPGGYPVRISPGDHRVELDLPWDGPIEPVELMARAARRDGIESIDRDGTVHFTSRAQAALRQVAAGLDEPLHPRDSCRRARAMIGALGIASNL